MRSPILRAAVVFFALGVLTALTIHAGLTACAPKPAPPAQAPQAQAPPPQAAAAADPPSAPAPATSAEDDDNSWRYMGASKAAPVFHPPRGKARPAVQQQNAAPPQAGP